MVYFKNYHKGLEVPFVIYADFEAINEKVHGCQSNNDKSYQKHRDCGNGYKVVCCYDDKYINQFRYIEERMLFISSWKNVRRS